VQGQNQTIGSLEAFRVLLGEKEETRLAVLTAVLDAHLLFGETGLTSEALRPLFEAWYASHGASLADTLTDLVRTGLLEAGTDSRYAVPEALRQTLAAELDSYIGFYPLQLPDGAVHFRELLDDFVRFCQSEWPGRLEMDQGTRVWGGRAFTCEGRRHFLLLRPSPLWLNAHAESYTLLLCKLPEDSIEPITEQLASQPGLRYRLALCDLDKAHKMNLTHSDLFVYLERYLRRVHGLRLVPPSTFTQGLVDRGLLSLDKG
jgi:hypothetical protein